MDVFCYLVACARTKEALFIDPAGNEEELVNFIREENLTLKYIVNTHGHADHTCGNKKVKALTGAKIVMHETDNRVFSTPEGYAMARQWGFEPSPPADETVQDGDAIVVGDVSLGVIHTPGHSPGGICLLSDGNLFTGDTLFVGGIGRTDLPGGDYKTIIHSLKVKLGALPDNLHGFQVLLVQALESFPDTRLRRDFSQRLGDQVGDQLGDKIRRF